MKIKTTAYQKAPLEEEKCKLPWPPQMGGMILNTYS